MMSRTMPKPPGRPKVDRVRGKKTVKAKAPLPGVRQAKPARPSPAPLPMPMEAPINRGMETMAPIRSGSPKPAKGK
jgi:hypothetical protein